MSNYLDSFETINFLYSYNFTLLIISVVAHPPTHTLNILNTYHTKYKIQNTAILLQTSHFPIYLHYITTNFVFCRKYDVKNDDSSVS
jgi:hypothetical protein